MKIETTKSWIQKCLQEKEYQVSNPILTEKELEELTKEVLFDLKSLFEHFIEAFNDLKSSFLQNTEEYKMIAEKGEFQTSLLRSIHLYDVADSPNAFMLFRKGHRLIFSPIKAGQIRIQLLKKEHDNITTIIDTQINAFSDNAMSIKWAHENQKGFVDLNSLSRHYMKCFLVESEKQTL